MINIVDEYIGLPLPIQVSSDVLARTFKTIKCSYEEWNELKVEYDKLPRGILKAMVVALLARSAKTQSQLETTLKLCDKYNPGPADMARKRLKEEFSV